MPAVPGSTTAGLTFVSDNPVYIQGDFNTGSSGPPSNGSNAYSGSTIPSPMGSVGYTRLNTAIVADAITVLSSNWTDVASLLPVTSRIARHTTVNTALVSGNVPSDKINYSGGGENFVRFLEDWTGCNFTYYGSMVQLYPSKQAIGKWTGSASVYVAPSLHWYYDANFSAGAPPGDLLVAAYLQQQRWYQVY